MAWWVWSTFRSAVRAYRSGSKSNRQRSLDQERRKTK